MARIVVADDHPVVREGLKKIIAGIGSMEVVAEAGTAEQLLELLPETDCDLVLLDISMPGRGGIAALEHITGTGNPVRVLILSVHSDPAYVTRVMKAGAMGYLEKDKAPEELADAIRSVAGGRKYISPSIAQRMALSQLEHSDNPPHESLSNREYQVLCKIASGKTVSGIAEELNLSVRTVSTYRARLLEKMDMSNNAELTRYAIRNSLVD